MKTKIDFSPEAKTDSIDWGTITKKYNTAIQTQVTLAGTKNMVGEIGRGSGKSTEMFAKRVVDVSFDMPRAIILLTGPTYVFILETIIPAILQYLTTNYARGVFFEYGKEPPLHFKRPISEIVRWQHTISFAWGTVIQFVSIDRPESAIGKNAVHVFVDETLRIKETDFRERIIPTLRSDRTLWGHSVFYGGMTMFSSAPNMENDHDWWRQYREKVNPTAINEIMYVQYRIMKAQGKMIALDQAIAREKTVNNRHEIEKIEAAIAKEQRFVNRWSAKVYTERRKKENWWHYIEGSSFSNLAHLGLEYMEQQLGGSGSNFDKFKLSILNIRPEAVKDKFIAKFNPNVHTFTDSYRYDFTDGYRDGSTDNYSIDGKYKKNSRDLKYCDPDRPLYMGYDPGDFSSVWMAQEKITATTRELRVLKNFWTYPPDDDHYFMATKISDFFCDHRARTIYLHYDRAGNQRKGRYAQNPKGKTDAEILKHELEQLGWTVHLETIGGRTIFFWEHFFLLGKLFGERDKNTPRIRICANECEEGISSIQNSPIKKTEDNFIELDKSSERRLDYEDQVRWSTQLCTSLMYLLWGLYHDLKPKGDPTTIDIEGL